MIEYFCLDFLQNYFWSQTGGQQKWKTVENLSPWFANSREQERRELSIAKRDHLLFFKWSKKPLNPKPQAKPNKEVNADFNFNPWSAIFCNLIVSYNYCASMQSTTPLILIDAYEKLLH